MERVKTVQKEQPNVSISTASTVERWAVIVLGMHRSGTSALSRALSLMGCTLPSNLMPANRGNEAGHWESQAIADFDDEILASADSSWHDFLPFSADWYASPLRADFVRRGAALLTQEYGSSPLFVLKDPRICRLAPLWFDILASLDVKPAVVLPLRNPLEVARSLARRDDMHEGYAQLLWLRHVLDAEFASRGLPRAVCSFDQLLADWHAVGTRLEAAFGLRWPRQSAITGTNIENFLRVDHRHERHQQPNHGLTAMVSIWVRKTYLILLAWSEEEENSKDHAELDDIRKAFDESAGALAGLIFGLVHDRENLSQLQTQHKTALAEGHARLAETVALLAEQEQALQTQLTALAERDEQIGALGEDLLDARREAEQFAADLAQARHRSAEMESAAIQRSEEATQAWAELEAERTIRANADKTVEELRSRLEAAEDSAAISQEQANAMQVTLDSVLQMHEERDVARISWMNQLHMVFSARPFWWSFLSPAMRRKREYQLLERAALFDRDAYLRRYPDVAAAGTDPLSHYLLHGMKEGRAAID